MPLGIGSVVEGRYRIDRQLGEGGMATTYLAFDALHDVPVALKLLREERSELASALRDEFVRLRGLAHPNLACVRDFGIIRGERARPFYTADPIEGRPLSRWARGRSSEEVLQPIADALAALSFLHELEIAHGDVKPENILVRSDGRGVLVDLGCAQRIGTPFGGAGTLDYLAPELLAGGALSRRSDLYALGITLARALDGSPMSDRTCSTLARLTASNASERPVDATEVLEALGVEAPSVHAPLGRAPRLLGRDALVARFRELLEGFLASQPGPRVLWLYGPDGIGRTRTLTELKWIAQLRAKTIEGTSLASMLGTAQGLSPILAALAGPREPTVLVLDDAHLLPEPEAQRLKAIVRALGDRDRVLLVCTAHEAEGIEGSLLEHVPLHALDEHALSAWAGPLLSQHGVRELLRVTGGLPAYVETLLSRVAAGQLRESELASSRAEGRSAAIARAGFQRLSPSERSVLAQLAVEESHDAIDAQSAARLSALGWIVRSDRAFRFARSADAHEVRALLAPEELARLHLSAAALSHIDVPSKIVHLVRAGELDRASALFAGARDSFDGAPAAWARAAREMARASGNPVSLVAAADALQLAGDASAALAVVAKALRARPAPDLARAARRVAGAACLRLGRLVRAERLLRAALSPDGSERAEVLDLLSRTLSQRGRYAEARALAEEGAAIAERPSLRAALDEDIGVAAAYLGEIDLARERLSRALAQHEGKTPRASVRIESYLALAEYRKGRFTEAAVHYRRALAIAEEHGLDDQHASALTNLGTVQQQLGDWGSALESYERALALAAALGKHSTEASLRFNLANLYAGVGQRARATALLPRLRADAERAGSSHARGSAELLEGELLLASNDLDAATSAFERARAFFTELALDRERLDAELGLAEVALARGSRADADRLAESVAEREKEHDIRARAALVLGRARDGARALATLETALEHAQASGERDSIARAHAALAAAALATGARSLSLDHARRARAEWERIAATLPEHLRAGFWDHPSRVSPPEPETTSRSESAQLRRILEINHRLSEARSTERVVEAALDAAIELCGAERGFVLLVERGELRVAAARNLDRERVGRSHLKFSRSIAERVIESGEPVTTIDAREDDRFASNESVHAMRLRSVACVPIRGPEDVLGAIYVDHRFERARFSSEDQPVLVAFADQVAIALRNARLHADLEARTRELEAEKKHVEELARAQAAEIDRLEAKTRAQEQALTYRYDYASLVGSSPAMQSVFAVLERVIDSTLSVLIQGESGTGKELVARAIHFNGLRKEGPFVAINCAAMPETLLESELFGYQRGAFSGAEQDREGLFVRARGGTLFLDELGETSAAMQAKLLRVLQDKLVRPIGARQDQSVDFRLVCATNRELSSEVEAGRFREDLYFRIAVVEVRLPPLRERIEDVPRLADVLLDRLAKEHGRAAPPRLSNAAVAALARHTWPGNVRELENVLGRALVMCEGDRIEARDLELAAAPRTRRPQSRVDFEREERETIRRALETARWNVSEACRALAMPRTSFYRKLARYGLAR